MSNSKLYLNKIVKKPWGQEYIIFENGVVAITMLEISKDNGTSLHCHTKKKTGLILLEGEIEVDLGFYEKKRVSTKYV